MSRKMGGSTSFRRTIGTYPRLTLEDARKAAQIWIGKMANGEDPLIIKKENQKKTAAKQADLRRTFAKVFEDYERIKNANSTEQTIDDRAKVAGWLSGSGLWSKSFAEIDTDIVSDALLPFFEGKIITRGLDTFQKDLATGWKIFRYCRAAYNLELARTKSDTKWNPFSQWTKTRNLPKPKRRQTSLATTSEGGKQWLRELMKLRTHERKRVRIVADYVLCCLLWGGRKTETLRLKADAVDFDRLRAMFIAPKNKRPHAFPLTPWAVDVLRERIKDNAGSAWVFPSYRKVDRPIVDARLVLRLLYERTGVKIRLHDLRRTFAGEIFEGAEGNLGTVKIVINHASAADDVSVGYIVDDAKLRTLRPLYERRERAIQELAGVMEKKSTDTELDRQIHAVLQDKKRRAALLQLLAQ